MLSREPTVASSECPPSWKMGGWHVPRYSGIAEARLVIRAKGGKRVSQEVSPTPRSHIASEVETETCCDQAARNVPAKSLAPAADLRVGTETYYYSIQFVEHPQHDMALLHACSCPDTNVPQNTLQSTNPTRNLPNSEPRASTSDRILATHLGKLGEQCLRMSAQGRLGLSWTVLASLTSKS